jgi:HlyD family secretion protein
VVPGATDGSVTEILEGDLREGQEVLTGMVVEAADAAGMSNPFGGARPPGMGGGGGGGGGRR